MKKFLRILVLSLLLSGNVFANDEHLDDFNQWLLNNGHTGLASVKEVYICKEFKRNIQKNGLMLNVSYIQKVEKF